MSIASITHYLCTCNLDAVHHVSSSIIVKQQPSSPVCLAAILIQSESGLCLDRRLRCAQTAMGEGACAADTLNLEPGSRLLPCWIPQAKQQPASSVRQALSSHGPVHHSMESEQESWKPHTWNSEGDDDYCDWDEGLGEWYQGDAELEMWQHEDHFKTMRWTRLVIKMCVLEYFKSRRMGKWSLQVLRRAAQGPNEGRPIKRSVDAPVDGAEPSGGHQGGIVIQGGCDFVRTKAPGSSSSGSQQISRHDIKMSARVTLAAPPVGHTLPKSPQPAAKLQRKCCLPSLPCFAKLSICS